MAPMSPSAGLDQVESLIPGRASYFDPHVRDPAPLLPFRKATNYITLDRLIATEIFLRDRSKLVFFGSSRLLPTHPLNTVQPFLKKIL